MKIIAKTRKQFTSRWQQCVTLQPLTLVSCVTHFHLFLQELVCVSVVGSADLVESVPAVTSRCGWAGRASVPENRFQTLRIILFFLCVCLYRRDLLMQEAGN